jgi:hypothetical protein
MFRGEGSVDVSARATFATTYSTSGNFRSAAFCRFAISVFSSSEMLGSAIGMNSRSPSFSCGMNSLPIPRARNNAPANRLTANRIVTSRCVSAAERAGS